MIANGLPLWGGAQVAVDTTLVSPLTAAGAPKKREGIAANHMLACDGMRTRRNGKGREPAESRLVATGILERSSACEAAYLLITPFGVGLVAALGKLLGPARHMGCHQKWQRLSGRAPPDFERASLQ